MAGLRMQPDFKGLEIPMITRNEFSSAVSGFNREGFELYPLLMDLFDDAVESDADDDYFLRTLVQPRANLSGHVRFELMFSTDGELEIIVTVFSDGDEQAYDVIYHLNESDEYVVSSASINGFDADETDVLTQISRLVNERKQA
jgi:hypothetical protein